MSINALLIRMLINRGMRSGYCQSSEKELEMYNDFCVKDPQLQQQMYTMVIRYNK